MTMTLNRGFWAPVGGKPTQSIDFEASSSQYLSMSDANFGAYNLAKFGISVWLRVESFGSSTYIVGQQDVGGRAFRFGFDSSARLDFAGSQNGSAFVSFLTTTATYSTATWYHVVLWYDSANATSGDRLRLWVNGVEITSFTADTAPTAALFNTADDFTWGVTFPSGASGHFDGLMYQAAVFSGTLPVAATIYNSGVPIDITGMTGLYSVLDVAGGSVTHDGVLASAWTNNNTAVASSTVP